MGSSENPENIFRIAGNSRNKQNFLNPRFPGKFPELKRLDYEPQNAPSPLRNTLKVETFARVFFQNINKTSPSPPPIWWECLSYQNR